MPSSRRIQPSLFDFVFVLWVTVIPIALSGRLLSTDGDLPRHLRLGEWMLTTRTGDRDELDRLPPADVWHELAVGPDRCRGPVCRERPTDGERVGRRVMIGLGQRRALSVYLRGCEVVD